MKDNYTYGKKMARKGHTKVIYKETFISDRSLAETSEDFCDGAFVRLLAAAAAEAAAAAAGPLMNGTS